MTRLDAATPRISLVLACALATACAGPTHDVSHMQRAQYAIDESTASQLVREAMDDYPLVERGDSDRLETRWIHGRDGSVFKMVVHIDGPGGGPFMVRIDTKLREKSGAIVEHDIPAWLAAKRDRLVVDIYERMKPAEMVPEAPAAVAGR